jgi:DNA-binding SARP family transcriptional activator
MSDIQYAYPLILNKVASPHYVTPTLRRARLLDWLHDAAGCRASVLAADAGYGKTTLLWQWEREVSFPCYWYKLDRNDRDWTLHISYLIEAISRRHKGFGRRAHSMLQQLGGPGSSRPGVAAYLLAEMHERLVEPCTFIIDDWQYVNGVTEVRGLWNQILRDAPPTCRFVFASRSRPRLQFARFKTHGGYAELGTDALRFTEGEIDELFRDIYNDPLDPTELAELERRTEGWAASLQLVEVSLRERRTPEERRDFIRSITATTDSDLFEFLAEEVLDQQPEDTRNFLLCTSILQQVTPELAERLAGVHDGRRELLDLEHRGLFTYRLDENRYRYHNLFRDFLERRLTNERTDAEVTGLHIHAASYFETTEQWPEAIHHYLRAGLQRQAARLLARHGEELAAEGRIGLIDEWLQQLPERTIRENARLSLLYGEACGVRGAWADALQSLGRAKNYFARKGDRRLEALACLKLSSVHQAYGDVESAAASAAEGLRYVPDDALDLRMRLEGDLAISHTWMTEGLAGAARACKRIAVEAAARGLEHYAAIALHNLGTIQYMMGDIREAVEHLGRAASFWIQIPNSPFADCGDFVLALLARDETARAQSISERAMLQTQPWPRPFADATCGKAAVHAYHGQWDEAIALLSGLLNDAASLGAARGYIGPLLVDCMFLAGSPPDDMASAMDRILDGPTDSRLTVAVVTAGALVSHASGDCRRMCLSARKAATAADTLGAHLPAAMSQMKLGVLAIDHGDAKAFKASVSALGHLSAMGVLRSIRWWTRRYSARAAEILRLPGGLELVLALLAADPDGWRLSVVRHVPETSGAARAELLQAIARYGNRETLDVLRDLEGTDVSEIRRTLSAQQAPRLFLRSFGNLAVHRGSWIGPLVPIDKRRLRLLLGLLVAHAGRAITRDQVIETLWPESDLPSGINSLNQAVFQLRRQLDPSYRDGESPLYVVSTADSVALNPDLVRTDLDAMRRIRDRAPGTGSGRERVTAALDLVRGEFLADLKYEEWASAAQPLVHAEVRDLFISYATGADYGISPDLRIRAAAAVLQLDEFDEEAHLAIANQLAASGRRSAARLALGRYVRRLREEFGEGPTEALLEAMSRLPS